MNVEMVNPFVSAAREVLRAELQTDVERGKIALNKSSKTEEDVTALIAVTGQVRGLVLYTLSQATACEFAGRMLDQECSELDALGQSSIAELANMITGKASMLLEEASLKSDISPPALVLGNGSTVSTVDLNRLVVPLETEYGSLSIHVALEAA